jgi:hypothetical protein
MDKKEKHRLWKREWRKNNPDKVLAQRTKDSAYMREYHKTYYPKNRVRMCERQRKIRASRLRFVVNFFGGKCIHCGFSDIRALQMDHTHGRNGEERLGNIDSRYFFVKTFPNEARAKYQLLCANCNFIKRVKNGEHRKSKFI